MSQREPTPDQGERVWTMLESSVYHRSRECPALNRGNRYHAPGLVPLAEATGLHPYRGGRRPCSLCAAPDEKEQS